MKRNFEKVRVAVFVGTLCEVRNWAEFLSAYFKLIKGRKTLTRDYCYGCGFFKLKFNGYCLLILS